jgi:hypothetical protein
MGHLSHRWGEAVALYSNKAGDKSLQTTWTSQTIQLLWKFTKTPWALQSTVVHSATDQEKVVKIREELNARYAFFMIFTIRHLQ